MIAQGAYPFLLWEKCALASEVSQMSTLFAALGMSCVLCIDRKGISATRMPYDQADKTGDPGD
jgi:hypothetical protein